MRIDAPDRELPRLAEDPPDLEPGAVRVDAPYLKAPASGLSGRTSSSSPASPPSCWRCGRRCSSARWTDAPTAPSRGFATAVLAADQIGCAIADRGLVAELARWAIGRPAALAMATHAGPARASRSTGPRYGRRRSPAPGRTADRNKPPLAHCATSAARAFSSCVTHWPIAGAFAGSAAFSAC